MRKSVFTTILAAFVLQFANIHAQTASYDAEYLKLVKEYTLNPDGSYDYHYHKEIRLLTHFSFHRLYGETFIVYNPQYQELKINECYTVMADGKKVVAPANAFNEVLPGFARDVAAYNHLREMVVTHTGTEVGAVITLDYTIKTKQGFQPFFGSEEIGEYVPVNDLSIIITVPQNIDLKHRMLNNRTAPSITENGGVKTFTWTMNNVKALPHTSNQDPDRKEILFFSTAKDMTNAFYAFVNQDAFKSLPGAAVSKRVDAAVKDKKSDLEIILALQQIVIDEVKLVDIPLIYSGYKVRTPDAVWQSANATSLEKAILLAGMLKLANINACPVSTVTNGWYSAEMGNPAVFDGYLVQVNPKETGRIYLSVNQKQSQNLIYDLQDKTMIQLDGAIESMRTFKEKGAENVLEMEVEIGLGEEEKGGQGDLEVEMAGICNPYFKLMNDSSHVKNMIAGDFASSSIKTIKEDQLAELKSSYIITSHQSPVTSNLNGFIYLDLPRFKTGFDAWNLLQFTSEGNTPVRLDFPLKEEYSYEITLPSEYSLFTPSTEINIKNDVGEINISISQSGSKVKIKRSFELFKDVISSDKMEEFKEMIVAWEKGDWRKLILKKEHE